MHLTFNFDPCRPWISSNYMGKLINQSAQLISGNNYYHHWWAKYRKSKAVECRWANHDIFRKFPLIQIFAGSISVTIVPIYCHSRNMHGMFEFHEYSSILMDLPEHSRRKVSKKKRICLHRPPHRHSTCCIQMLGIPVTESEMRKYDFVSLKFIITIILWAECRSFSVEQMYLFIIRINTGAQ